MKQSFPRLVPLLLLCGAFPLGASAAAPAAAESTPASTCLSAATWTRLEGARLHPAGVDSVIADMAKREVVLLGEQHDAADDHRWQLQTLAALHAQRPEMVIGFEMFPRRMQPVLDRWVAGELTEQQFLEQSEWAKGWAMPAELYLPLFEFARMNRIPMLALDIEQKLSRSVAEKGWDAISSAEREGVTRAAPPAAAYRDFLRQAYSEHPSMTQAAHGEGEAGAAGKGADRAFDRFVEAQISRDRAMAEALAHRAGSAPAGRKPLMVGVMGNGHIRFGWGVPHQLRDLGVKHIGVLLPVSLDADCASLRSGLADAVFSLPEQVAPPAERPRLGVRLESAQGKVSIAEVAAGSLAEKSGLKRGDRLLQVAGQTVSRTFEVVGLVRRQPGGTWLPLQVRRGDETLDLLVKFPVQP